MEKILLAIDALNPDKNSLEFACFLARLTKSKMTGIFLDDTEMEEMAIVDKSGGTIKSGLIEKNIRWFNEKCVGEETKHDLHTDSGIPLNELILESRYADLVIVDSETSFNKPYEGSPTRFVKDFLNHAECPVVIAPESFEGIDEIVLAYNGSPSSVFAIKQFSYLFPQFSSKKITVVQVSECGKWNEKEKDKLSEWLKAHYYHFDFISLKGEADIALFDYLWKRRNVLLVMGAFGRGSISQFFKKSRAELIIKTITQPIFIAHQ